MRPDATLKLQTPGVTLAATPGVTLGVTPPTPRQHESTPEMGATERIRFGELGPRAPGAGSLQQRMAASIRSTLKAARQGV